MGWFCYLEEHLQFPFRAKCLKVRATSPLRKGEEVMVIKLAPEDDCESDMLVIIEWRERTLGVPLAQLEGTSVDKETKQAIADWHYWIAQGYES
jgi:predicted  nucleic acid-binding Zn ribbon protein